MFAHFLLDRNVVFGPAIACLLTCVGGATSYVMIAEKHRKLLEKQGGLQAGALVPPEYSVEDATKKFHRRIAELRGQRSWSDSE